MDVLPTVQIRPLVERDAEAMAHLHLDVWEEAYAGLMPASVFAERRAATDDRAAMWRRIAAESPTPTLVAVHDRALIGFASVGPARDDDVDVHEELWALYIRAAWYGTGLGHRLLTEVVGERPAYLWVLRGNVRAIGFYRRHGFTFDTAEREDEFGVELRMVRH
jgi:GNAT superfamily N-acetyltransferase